MAQLFTLALFGGFVALGIWANKMVIGALCGAIIVIIICAFL